MIPWTVAHQTPLSMEFSRQEYRSGLPCPHPGDLLDPGIKPESPELYVDSLLIEPSGEGNGYPLQSCCLENSMDRGAWQATAHGITKSGTQLSNYHWNKSEFEALSLR